MKPEFYIYLFEDELSTSNDDRTSLITITRRLYEINFNTSFILSKKSLKMTDEQFSILNEYLKEMLGKCCMELDFRIKKLLRNE